MTTHAEIPDSDSVVRYVGFTGIRDGKADGSQFCRRPGEDGPSINWLECFAGLTKWQQVAEVRQVIHLRLGSQAVFAELEVGDVKRHLRDKLTNVRFVKDPSSATEQFPKPDPSHSKIIGLPPSDDEAYALMIGDMIAKRVKALHPASPPPAE